MNEASYSLSHDGSHCSRFALDAPCPVHSHNLHGHCHCHRALPCTGAFRRRDDARLLQEAANTSHGILLPGSTIRRAFVPGRGDRPIDDSCRAAIKAAPSATSNTGRIIFSIYFSFIMLFQSGMVIVELCKKIPIAVASSVLWRRNIDLVESGVHHVVCIICMYELETINCRDGHTRYRSYCGTSPV